ncbi:MAG: hypothetical protein ACKOE2_05910 [Actinomycetales bacterium]
MTWAVAIAAVVAALVAGWLTWFVLRRRILIARMTEVLRAEGHTRPAPRRRRSAPLPIRDAADVRFTFVLRDVQRSPGDWRSWFRLSLAYSETGDRKRARKAMRRALGLFAGSRASATADRTSG